MKNRWIWALAVGLAALAAWVVLPSLIVRPSARSTSTRSPHPKLRSPKQEIAGPSSTSRIVVDSKLSREEALANTGFPKDLVDQMDLVAVRYIGFDGLEHRGQIVVNRKLVAEVRDIFEELFRKRWPIDQVVPIVKYGWDDERSMVDNNTSGFNYRKTSGPGLGRNLSKHAFGRAIDLNPFQNPFLDARGKRPWPYDPTQKGTITRTSAAYRAFRRRGWTWGGDWRGAKDYQHFERRIN